jgi:hypothetical protein
VSNMIGPSPLEAETDEGLCASCVHVDCDCFRPPGYGGPCRHCRVEDEDAELDCGGYCSPYDQCVKCLVS